MSMKTSIFRQLFDNKTSTYTYILADKDSREGLIIDPVLHQFDRDVELIRELEIKPLYLLETHIHADHITSAAMLKNEFGLLTVYSKEAGSSFADLEVSDEDELHIGQLKVRCLSTPGHTKGCMSYGIPGMVFTGDALLIRGAGRTDFQEGSASELYRSIMVKLYALDEETLVFPAHDYQGRRCSTIGEEKRFNKRIRQSTSVQEFEKTMAELQLPYPEMMSEAVPRNKIGGNEPVFV